MTSEAAQNIAAFLPEQARLRPDQVAVLHETPRGCERLTYAELARKSNALAWGLAGCGIAQGTRVLLMVPAGLPLLALGFALFQVGAVPILIDPAMGTQNIRQCIAEAAPEALIGVPRAHLLRLAAPGALRHVRRWVTVGRYAAPGSLRLGALESVGAGVAAPYPTATVAADDTAAIAFTTGSTGVPKGVLYEHSMLNAQCAVLREHYGIQQGEVEMPVFPLFVLFNVAMGLTSAIPPIDPTRPAACDPAEVVSFIQRHRVTSSFGSPAIWAKVAAHCAERGERLPSLRRVMMAGAPVPARLHAQMLPLLGEGGGTHTPYGATEALPITSIGGREVLAAQAERGPTAGACLGLPLPGMELRIIPIGEDALTSWTDVEPLPPEAVGEIVVCGPMVTRRYLARPEANRLAKIADGARVWHRMGDVGYLDAQGRLWFCGRKAHRVPTAGGTLFTEQVEPVFNQHPEVARTALVGLGGGALRTPAIVAEPRPGHFPRSRAERARLAHELLALGASTPLTAGIRTVLFHPAFPVDVRHNAKIFRDRLAAWAERQRPLQEAGF
ncbi:AMP-binding protein [Chloroflexia bacterium SDU3-3]|nr:AMP-binding protein [Chloroflexia bacterium SDU3-3]